MTVRLPRSASARRMRFSGLVFLFALLTTRAFAQDTVNAGSVSGRVTDASGAVIIGAQVTARQLDTNVTQNAVSDNDGYFRLTYLRIGPYEITVRATGFADSTRQLTLKAGSAFQLPIALSIEAQQESVAVNASAIVLETARSQIAGTVTQNEIENLPLNGRNFQDIALLVPGVASPNLGSTRPALCRNVGGCRSGTLDQQPAQSLEQLHRRRTVVERRRGGACRHGVRR